MSDVWCTFTKTFHGRTFFQNDRANRVAKNNTGQFSAARRECTHLRRLYVLIFINDRYIIERLSEGEVLVLVVELLLVIVRRAESFPRQGVDEQRVLLQVLLQSILLRDDSRVVVVVQVNIIVL